MVAETQRLEEAARLAMANFETGDAPVHPAWESLYAKLTMVAMIVLSGGMASYILF